jgi:hypothetical protein
VACVLGIAGQHRVSDFLAGVSACLVATHYADACPIATVALEVASTNEALHRPSRDVGW